MVNTKFFRFLAIFLLLASFGGGIAFCFTILDMTAKIAIVASMFLSGIIYCVIFNGIATNREMIEKMSNKAVKSDSLFQEESLKVGDSVILTRDFIADDNVTIKEGTVGKIYLLAGSRKMVVFSIDGKDITATIPTSLLKKND